MMMSEKQRAYRYGMTLLCIGAFFNWLGLNEHNSDPLRFIGFTCLSSGALLVCLAICMWANTPRNRNNQESEASGEGEVRVDVGETQEKPPDYDTLAALATPPPCYLDAIKLSPLALALSEREREMNPSVTVEVHDSGRRNENNNKEGESSSGEVSRIGRMLRLSSRIILRRTMSSPGQPPDPIPERPPRIPVNRAISMLQEPKNI